MQEQIEVAGEHLGTAYFTLLVNDCREELWKTRKAYRLCVNAAPDDLDAFLEAERLWNESTADVQHILQTALDEWQHSIIQ